MNVSLVEVLDCLVHRVRAHFVFRIISHSFGSTTSGDVITRKVGYELGILAIGVLAILSSLTVMQSLFLLLKKFQAE